MALGDAAERKIGRHLSCPATFDEHTMAMLKEWRRQQSAEQKVPAFVVFTDATLIAIAEARPRSRADLLKVQGLGADQGRPLRRGGAGHRGRRGAARRRLTRRPPNNPGTRRSLIPLRASRHLP